MVLCLMIVGIHASEILSPLAQFILVRLGETERPTQDIIKEHEKETTDC